METSGFCKTLNRLLNGTFQDHPDKGDTSTGWKMASTGDGDLIDLENTSNGGNPRVSRIPSTHATLEEQEHLLDVCPPKLEQKLSLTRRSEQVLNLEDENDVLVTLGHDQVVPIRKRIDVVSSDTIKRIRDITKNLEPVIRKSSDGGEEFYDTVDHPDTVKDDTEDTFEAQEINNAFNFLSELEDNCSIDEESRPSEEKAIEECQDLGYRTFGPRRLRGECGDKRSRGDEDKDVYESASKRLDRKSWTESSVFSPASRDATRSVSVDVDYYCEPSTSAGTRHEESEGSNGNAAEESLFTPEESSSDGSEVDWSWVEEVECPRAGEPAGTAGTGRRDERSHPTMREERMREQIVAAQDSNGSVAMSVAATAKSLAIGSAWSPVTVNNNPGQGNNDGNHSRPDNNDTGGRPPTATTSWVRASMRRIRHLRLPEAVRNVAGNSNVSAPNSLPDIALIAPEILAAQTNGTANTLLRPSSAPQPLRNPTPGSTPARRGRRQQSNRLRDAARPGQTCTSGTVSDNSTCSTSTSGGISSSTSPASSAPTSPQHVTSPAAMARRVCERPRDADREDERGEDDDEDENRLGRWPHALSPALACLGCTLGLFNISRFAILSIQFGANFIIQFLVLSLILGIPLFTLQVCLGQRLSAGAVDMWKISPLFQGVGIALLAAQAFIGIYSIVGVSWMFVYFRDSFITKLDKYRWAEPFLLYREDTKPVYNTSTSYKLQETVPDYFSGAVLQRHHLTEPELGVVTLKFQVAFNLAVVWMIVFVSLSKGLRSYGKVVYVFTLVPIFGTLILCTKLLGLTPPGSIHQLFPATVWSEFFINSKSWVAASSEVFLTWGLLGAAAMQIAAHNKHKHLLQRDTSLVIVLTIVVLLLAAFLANTCVQILRHHGYVYTTSSFERISGYTFMRPANQPAPVGYSSTPERFMAHASFLIGQRVTRPGADVTVDSGYQVLRLSTELVPATLAILGTEQVSPFWAVLFYFILIFFGIAQQLAIWHCVITGIMAINTKMMKLWETTITFFSCACAYILGLPMATELGIYVVYYLDYTVGGSWWIMVLYLVQVAAVFAVRGRPHTGEAVVAELFPPTGRCLRHWAGPLLSFTWNVILPITLTVLSITVFKSSGFRELYTYRRANRDYWTLWARQLGAAIQLIPILMIPAVAIIQTCRYLNKGPPDIFDTDQVEVNVSHCNRCHGRIQLLYRPALEVDDSRDGQTQIGGDTANIHGTGILPATTEVPFEDPPPKYTPPPSYTTATGARIAKMLRQSFRRSVRRIANVLGEGSAPRTRPALQPPPPDYATVLVEMNQGIRSSDVTIHITDPVCADSTGPLDLNRAIDRMPAISTVERTFSSLERDRRSNYTGSSNLTAADVANLLRSSIRRGTARTQQTLRRSFTNESSTATTASVENLVEAAAPICQDSLVLPKDVSLVSTNNEKDDDGNDKKTADEMDNSVSVI